MTGHFSPTTAKWDRRFLAMAQEVAGWSKDPDCQVGAVVVSPSRRQFSVGYNGFPAGVPDLYDCTKEEKLELTVHAERNAILNARRDLTGWTLYTTKDPCLDCAIDIRQATLHRVVLAPTQEAHPRWKDSQHKALQLLLGCGIEVARVVPED